MPSICTELYICIANIAKKAANPPHQGKENTVSFDLLVAFVEPAQLLPILMGTEPYLQPFKGQELTVLSYSGAKLGPVGL